MAGLGRPPRLVALLDVPRAPADWEDRMAVLVASGVVDVFVLRAKTYDAGTQWEWARRFAAQTAGHPWLVADRVDVAQAAGATGVHLPAAGLPTAVVRQLWPGAVVSRAVHGPEDWGADEPDWWVFGHVFPTRSKPGSAPRPATLARAVLSMCHVPVLAIGGVSPANAGQVRRLGFSGAVVADALWTAPDPVAQARAIRSFWDEGGERSACDS
jgi:thiazole tautomerase (transcriptional regulator TenI)